MEITAQFDTLQILEQMTKNLRIMSEYLQNGRKEIKLSIDQWITPIAILPIAMYSSMHNLTVDWTENEGDICRYLKTIRFPRGTKSLPYTRKSYLPISRLSCQIRDTILGKYEERILRNINNIQYRGPLTNSLKILTSELVTNVREHSNVDNYWILAQYWDSTETCEMVIADTGIGYRDSYIGTIFEVKYHHEAIFNAIQGFSSKDPNERGAGIPSMIKIICEGYKGEIIMMSGDSLIYLKDGDIERYRIRCDWQGAFIGIRFKVSDMNPLVLLGKG